VDHQQRVLVEAVRDVEAFAMQVLARDRQLVQFGQQAPPQRRQLRGVIGADIVDLRLVFGLERVEA
jgi:hypothetical protein